MIMKKIHSFIITLIVLSIFISIPVSAKTVKKLGKGSYGTHSDCATVMVKGKKLVIGKYSSLVNSKNDQDIYLTKTNSFSYSSKCRFYVQKSYTNYSTGAEKIYKKKKCSRRKLLTTLKKYNNGCNYSWDFKIKNNKIVKLFVLIERVKW